MCLRCTRVNRKNAAALQASGLVSQPRQKEEPLVSTDCGEPRALPPSGLPAPTLRFQVKRCREGGTELPLEEPQGSGALAERRASTQPHAEPWLVPAGLQR